MTEQTQRVSQGDRVRVDIPDETHPAHDSHHGRHSEVIAILPVSAVEITGGSRGQGRAGSRRTYQSQRTTGVPAGKTRSTVARSRGRPD